MLVTAIAGSASSRCSSAIVECDWSLGKKMSSTFLLNIELKIKCPNVFVVNLHYWKKLVSTGKEQAVVLRVLVM